MLLRLRMAAAPPKPFLLPMNDVFWALAHDVVAQLLKMYWRDVLGQPVG